MKEFKNIYYNSKRKHYKDGLNNRTKKIEQRVDELEGRKNCSK
jgi:hypothetical protein